MGERMYPTKVAIGGYYQWLPQVEQSEVVSVGGDIFVRNRKAGGVRGE